MAATSPAVAILSQFISAGGAVLLTLVTAIALGPDGRGEVAYFLLFSTLYAYLLGLGFPGSAIRAAAETDNELPRIVGATVIHAVMVSLILLPLAAEGALAGILRPLRDTSPQLAIASLLLALTTNNLSWAEYGRGNIAASNVLKAVIPGGTGLWVAAIAATGNSITPNAVASSYVALQALITATFFLRLVRSGAPVLSVTYTKLALVTGMPYFVVVISQLMVQRLDQAVLALTAPPESLGIYSVAASASEAVTYAPTALALLAFGSAARSGSADRRLLLRQAMYVGIPGAFLISIAASAFIVLVLGDQYASAVPLLLILAPGAVGLAVGRMLTNAMAGLGCLRRANFVVVAQASAMGLLYVALIPVFGSAAAAVISSVGYIAGAFALYAVFPQTDARLVEGGG